MNISKPPLRVVSLFCGMGNADAGLYDAAEELGVNVEIVAAYDSWSKAVEVYNANLHPVAQVADVKALQSIPDCDLVIGGPPCQPFSTAGKRIGHDDPRNCIPDFLRLVGDRAYVMENVRHLLINAPWSERLCAFDFGDVTVRRRWFYSNYLLHVVRTPGPRRFRDIRDHEADAKAVAMRSYPKPFSAVAEDGALGSLTSHTHDQPLRVGQSKPTTDDDALGTLTSGKGGVSGFLRVALRSHSSQILHIEDDGAVGALTASSRHGFKQNGSKTITARTMVDGVRCPTLLEMARSHSIPDSWDWLNVSKTDKGKMIANSWPRAMAKAINKAILSAIVAEREIAA